VYHLTDVDILVQVQKTTTKLVLCQSCRKKTQ